MMPYTAKLSVPAMMLLGLLYAGTARPAADETGQPGDIHRQIQEIDSLIDLRQLDSALSLCQLTLAKARQEFGESDTTVATALRLLGKCYYHKADYGASDTLFRQALQIRRHHWGENHRSVAQSLNDLAMLCVKQARYAEAEDLYNRTATILEQILGPHHRNVASVLNNLGNLYCEQAKYEDAEPLYMRSLEIETAISGEGSAEVAGVLNNLGLLYMDQARFGEAEQFFTRSLAIKEAKYGPGHPIVARSCNNLALLSMRQARYETAESLYNRALTIFETAFGPDHPDVAHALTNLGLLFQKQKRYTEAISFHQRALAMRRNILGDDHPAVARSLNNLGSIYADQGHHPEAEAAYREALAIRTQALGPGHPDAAQSLYNVGTSRLKQGDFEGARECYLQAYAIRDSLFGPDHPIVAKTLSSLATVSGLLEDPEGGLHFYEKELQSKIQFIHYLFTYASEDLKMRYIGEYPLADQTLISFAILTGSDRARNLAMKMILTSKGAIIDALSAERQFAFCSYDDHVRDNIQHHAELCGEISTLTLVGADKLPAETYRQRLHTLFSQKDSLETDLSKICGEFRDNLAEKTITVSDVARRLPESTVLWEFVRYVPYDFRRERISADTTMVPQYAAFTLDSRGPVTLQDLGPAAIIDSLIRMTRERLYSDRGAVFSSFSGEAERQLAEITGRLYALIFEPLARHLGNEVDILIAPDGQLSLIPFEILTAPTGEYVVEKYRISYLSSGRDVPRFGRGQDPEPVALVLADPDFTTAGEISASLRENAETDVDYSLLDGNASRRPDDCLCMSFDPLPGTRIEAGSVDSILAKTANLRVDVLVGREASEETIKSLKAPPRILHLATHGFFCEDINIDEPHAYQMSLLRSGLAFSGANNIIPGPHQTATSGEDGVLTAFEASGLNLVGTELVVMSACESGVGTVKNGEGVYGLRRAFQHAGARSIIMSLWKVPDEETRRLIIGFYAAWGNGLPKKHAFHQAVTSLVKACRAEYGSAHPLLWGGFIFVGDVN